MEISKVQPAGDVEVTTAAVDLRVPTPEAVFMPSNENLLFFDCVFCDYTAPNQDELEVHYCPAMEQWDKIENDIFDFTCPTCNHIETSMESVLNHDCLSRQNEQVNLPSDLALMTCTICNFKSLNIDYFNSHKCNEEGFVFSPVDDYNDDDEAVFVCRFCEFGTDNSQEFLDHQCLPKIVFDAPTRYKCSHCSFNTLSAEEWLFHACSNKANHSINEPCTSNCNHIDKLNPGIKRKSVNDANPNKINADSNKRMKRSNSKANFKCVKCNRGFMREEAYLSHLEWCRNRVNIDPLAVDDNSTGHFQQIATAFNRFVTYENRDIENLDVQSLQVENLDSLSNIIKEYLQSYQCLKFELIIDAQMRHPLSEDVRIRHCFHSVLRSVLQGDDILALLNRAFDDISELVDNYTERGSGWTLDMIKSIRINIGKFIPHRGGCSQHLLPIDLQNKKCLINIQTLNECFIYSVMACLHEPANNPQRKSQYTRFIANYDLTDLTDEDVDLKQAERFAKRNNLKINIYTYNLEEKCIIPLLIMSNENEVPVLLFLYDNHYYKISKFNRLASFANKHSRYHCYRCLSAYISTEALEKHKKDCADVAAQRLILPDGSNNSSKFFFDKYQNQIIHPYVIYADFETLSVGTDDDYCVRTLPACSYGYVVVDWEGKIIVKDFARGDNIGKRFLQSLVETKTKLHEDLTTRSKPLRMTDDEESRFQMATQCHICSGRLGKDKVRDHDHLTGNYRGAAHNACNLKLRIPMKLPVFFHNLKNFDAHIIFKALDAEFAEEISIIPHTIEKYVAFMCKGFVFLDSFAFLPSSLDSLAENIPVDIKESFLLQIFQGDVSRLMRKAVLPYEYMDSLERFDETSLPPIDKFYSSLKDSNINQEMYAHLKNIWDQFNCKTLGDFHDIYLKVDVILLAAVFENFRRVSHHHFELDPCHNFSVPGFSMNSALKYTGARAGLLIDIDMLLTVEKGIRGGLTVVSKRHCKSIQGVNEIIYLDVNNLYGAAMSEPLPYDGFEWVDTKSQNITQLLSKCQGDIGMIFEVDLIYPECLHDAHNDYPLAPHRMKVTPDNYSKYQKGLFKRLREKKIKPAASKKLLASFLPREHYVVHHRLLKYYLSKGLIVSAVHKAFKFREKSWLKAYVDFCTAQRKMARTSFERDFWKLMVNAIYGKTIEDKRKHKIVQSIFREMLALKRLRSELCESFTIIDEDKILFQLRKSSVYMNKPVCVGFSVLELAKLKMFELHYDNFKAKLGNRVELLYTDTDSLIYNIQTPDITTTLAEFSDIMDFSNYDPNHPLYNTQYEKTIGYLKDEMGGKRIEEFIALKPKLYAIKTAEGEEKKRAKGIQKATVEKNISFDCYMECLKNEFIPTAFQRRLASKKHSINMIVNQKIVMTPFDDKRYLLDDGISSLAYGHFVTKNSF